MALNVVNKYDIFGLQIFFMARQQYNYHVYVVFLIQFSLCYVSVCKLVLLS